MSVTRAHASPGTLAVKMPSWAARSVPVLSRSRWVLNGMSRSCSRCIGSVPGSGPPLRTASRAALILRLWAGLRRAGSVLISSVSDVPVVPEHGHVADPQAVRQVVQERELAVLLVGLVDAGEFCCQPFFARHHPRRGILAQGDDVPALEPEHPPGKRVSHAAVLPGQPLAHFVFQPPGFQVRRSRPGLRLRGSGCGGFRPHPLDSPRERVPVGLHLQDAREQLPLELVALLHIGACPKRGDQLRELRLGSQVPGMRERPFNRGQPIRRLHRTSVTETRDKSHRLASLCARGVSTSAAASRARIPSTPARIRAECALWLGAPPGCHRPSGVPP